MRALSLSFLCLVLLTGCGGSALEPPAGWTGEGDRWWRTGADTAMAFRDLSSFSAMGVERSEQAFINDVRAELFTFYRANPEAVDSLFRARVEPIAVRAAVRGETDPTATVATAQRELAFRQPRPKLQLGKDVPVVFPDSLREAGIGGRVSLQVALDAEGVPLAARVVESVHPTLDRSALLAATQMRWSKAYAVQEAVPAWVFWNVVFNTGP
jgi:TonB family protein